jgi:formylglycine-generating enzyme required for sulfatase activity
MMKTASTMVAMAVLAGCSRNRPSPPADDMIAIPAQKFIGDDTDCPAGTVNRRSFDQWHHVALRAPAFRIDRRVVTCADFDRCVDAGACTHKLMKCKEGLAAAQRPAAEAYCKWRDAQLPSWNEWQLAIRGPDGWEYPTGHEKRPEFDAPETPEGTVYTSPEGVEYRFNARSFLGNELTRDDDCLETAPGFFFPAVISGFTIGMIYETMSKAGTERGLFRCVRE